MVQDNKAKLTYTQLLKEDLGIFRLVPEDGVIPDFKAGQFLTLGMPVPGEDNKIVRRAYSIASHPENKKFFEFVIRWVRKPFPGRLTTELFNAKEGADVSWIKPTGHLTINDELPNGDPDTRRIVCIGGGTGLAPFVSFAQHLHDIGDKREIVVLHGASYVDELSYKQLLTDLENESLDRGTDKWNFKYRAAISRPQEWFNRAWTGQTGRVEQFLRTKSVEKESDTYRIFMLGGSTMFGHGATSDKTTIPGYAQEFFINNKFYQVEVINAGIQGADSFAELDLIKNKIQNLSPDMLIIYDGWNDLREQNTSTTLSKNWNSMCEIGKENDLQVVIALQPIAGFGNKPLTSQEEQYVNTGTNYENIPLIDSRDEYENYSLELETMKNCTLTLNLTDIFDQETSAIYWDQGHVSDKGNSIVAKSLFDEISLFLPESPQLYQIKPDVITQTTETTFDHYIKYLLSGYKTPLMINSILPFQESTSSKHLNQENTSHEQTNQIPFSTFTTNTIDYNGDPVSIVLEIDHDENTLEIRTINNKNNTNYENVTYFLKIFKDEQLILSDYLFSKEIFLFNIISNSDNLLKISGDRQYNHNAMIMTDSNPPKMIGSIFKNDEVYEFSLDILTLNDKNEWIFSLTDFTVSVSIMNL